jgi:hypothetical protein
MNDTLGKLVETGALGGAAQDALGGHLDEDQFDGT